MKQFQFEMFVGPRWPFEPWRCAFARWELGGAKIFLMRGTWPKRYFLLGAEGGYYVLEGRD